MLMIQVFEGPLCCNTGVCGTDPDQALVDFTADLDWLTRQGVQVARANLAQDPAAFAESATARAFVQKVGAAGLPLIVVDDVTVVTGRYPSRAELSQLAGVAPPVSPSSGCCSDADSATATTECCSEPPATSEASGCCSSAQPVSIQPGPNAERAS